MKFIINQVIYFSINKLLISMFQNLPTLCFVAPKTFVIDSCDQIVAVVLKENGWKQISKSSNSWNFKWTWKVTPKEHEAMQNGQIINHFKGSDQLSTKIGLNLLYKRNPIVMDCGRSFTNFYPRSYNLSTQKSEFIHNFIQTGIFNLLKKIIVCLQIFNKQQYELAQRLKLQYRQKSTSDIIHFLFHKQNENITDKNPGNQKLRINGKIYVRLLLFLQNMFSLQDHFDFQKEELIQREIPFEQNEQTNGQIIVPSIQSLTLLLIYHAKCMKMVRGFYEDGFSNIWVVKSNHSSRGRNIALVDKLEDVENLDNGMKLIQKYIQNIWILHEMTEDQTSKYPTMTRILKKKFDMRFWVLVKSFSPLTVYIYNEAYLRVSSESYRLDGLSEKNSHLTNFSVNWKSKQKFGQAQPSYVLFSHFLSYLKDEQQIDVLSLTKRIHEIILQTLKLVQIKSDEKCFQLFGFDIILDAKLNPWILECNMSPACSPRGELRNIVKQMTTGLLSILGLIESNNFGWKVLYDQKKKSSKINTVCRILKQTAQNFTTTKTPLKSPSTQLTLTSQRLKWRKYRQIEHLHYITQKIIYIQRYIKQKLASQPHHSTQTLNISNITDKNENKNENTNKNKSGTRVLMMIQILSRVIKRTKKNQWAKFMPIIRRKLSKKKSKFV